MRRGRRCLHRANDWFCPAYLSQDADRGRWPRRAVAPGAHARARSAWPCSSRSRWRCSVRRSRAGRLVALGVGGVIYTIPSLALFVLLGPGLRLHQRAAGRRRAGARTTCRCWCGSCSSGSTACRRTSSRPRSGVGYGPARGCSPGSSCRWRCPRCVAGLRLAAVSTIALVTVGAVIGHGGLGHAAVRRLPDRLPGPAADQPGAGRACCAGRRPAAAARRCGCSRRGSGAGGGRHEPARGHRRLARRPGALPRHRRRAAAAGGAPGADRHRGRASPPLVALPVGLLLGHLRRGGTAVTALTNASRAVPDARRAHRLLRHRQHRHRQPGGRRSRWCCSPSRRSWSTPTSASPGWSREVVEAARGMGMGEARGSCCSVELPLALPLVVAGLRTAVGAGHRHGHAGGVRRGRRARHVHQQRVRPAGLPAGARAARSGSRRWRWRRRSLLAGLQRLVDAGAAAGCARLGRVTAEGLSDVPCLDDGERACPSDTRAAPAARDTEGELLPCALPGSPSSPPSRRCRWPSRRCSDSGNDTATGASASAGAVASGSSRDGLRRPSPVTSSSRSTTTRSCRTATTSSRSCAPTSVTDPLTTALNKVSARADPGRAQRPEQGHRRRPRVSRRRPPTSFVAGAGPRPSGLSGGSGPIKVGRRRTSARTRPSRTSTPTSSRAPASTPRRAADQPRGLRGGAARRATSTSSPSTPRRSPSSSTPRPTGRTPPPRPAATSTRPSPRSRSWPSPKGLTVAGAGRGHRPERVRRHVGLRRQVQGLVAVRAGLDLRRRRHARRAAGVPGAAVLPAGPAGRPTA